jgi:hypothetical protein
MDRWVCLRCDAANDGWRAHCGKCGLLRGSVPPPESPTVVTPGTRSTSVAAPRNLLVGILRRFGWLIVVLAIAVGGAFFAAHRDSTGKITSGGSLPIGDLAVGDCFNRKDPTASAADEVDAKRCDDKHQFELFAIATMSAGEYPTESEMDAFVGDRCLPAFGTYVGRTYDQSGLEISWYYPTKDGWGRGDHVIQCAASDPLDSQLTASLKGADR